MAFTVPVAADVTASTLEKFFNPKDPKKILQHIQNKPLLKKLLDRKEEFDAAGPAAGTTSPANFREPVQGALLRDQPGFYVGIAGASVLSFKSSDGALQTTCPVRWMHAGWQITHEELMYQGVIVTNNNKDVAAPTDDDQVKLFNALQLKKADYQESIQYARNNTLWLDGTQDALAMPGMFSILTDDPTAGVTLGINRQNVWWRHVADTGIGNANPKLVYSKSDQSLTERLNKVITVILPLYGGKPDKALAGSDLIDALIKEMRAKGMNTVDSWEDNFDLACTGIRFKGLDIEFDPTLDLLGRSKRIVIWDSNHLKLRTQKGQWGKVTAQNQPADQFVMLTSTTDRGVLSCNQMDCNYVGDMN